VLLATLAVTMTPLTWEDRRVVWIVMAILVGFSQARLVGLLGLEAQPVPASVGSPVRSRSEAARARQRPLVTRGEVPDAGT
jgi:hypothetical protein